MKQEFSLIVDNEKVTYTLPLTTPKLTSNGVVWIGKFFLPPEIIKFKIGKFLKKKFLFFPLFLFDWKFSRIKIKFLILGGKKKIPRYFPVRIPYKGCLRNLRISSQLVNIRREFASNRTYRRCGNEFDLKT